MNENYQNAKLVHFVTIIKRKFSSLAFDVNEGSRQGCYHLFKFVLMLTFINESQLTL